MPTLSEVRQQYPQYGDMSDEDLAGALHKKSYSDMPREDFNSKIGLGADLAAQLGARNVGTAPEAETGAGLASAEVPVTGAGLLKAADQGLAQS
jgi:hypothetical protein